MAKAVGAVLFSHRTPEEGADVVFEVGEERTKEDIWAHKAVLITMSSVMKAQLTGKFREANELRVRIPDVHPRPFIGFLQVIYTGSAKTPIDRPPTMERELAVVHVTNISVSLKEWKEMIEHASLFEHLDAKRHGLTVTRATKSSGRVEEVWLNCANLASAKAVVDKIGSQIGHAEIAGMRNSEFVLDVIVLLDRYGITDRIDWVVSEVKQFVGLGSDFMNLVMCTAWSLAPGSDYRKAILDLCKTIVKKQLGDDDSDDSDDDSDFDSDVVSYGSWEEVSDCLMLLIYPLPPHDNHTALQVRMQLLHWVSGSFTKYLLADDTEPSTEDEHFRLTLARCNQELIDRWSGNNQRDELESKRRRTAV